MEKICENCNTEVSFDSKFCTTCGAQLEASASSEASAAKEESSATTETATNDYAAQGKDLAKGYWAHIVHMFKSPLRHGKSEGEANFVNGIITLVLFALFIPLTLYFGLQSIYSSFGGFLGESVPFSTVFFKPFFLILLFVAVAVGILFAVTKPGLPKLDFKAVVGRFGALMVIPTVTMLLALLVVVMSLYSLFGYVFLLGFVGMFIAATLTIYSFVNETDKGLDGFYATLIFYLGTFLYINIMYENLFLNQFLNQMF